jgi:hypothetical protein
VPLELALFTSHKETRDAIDSKWGTGLRESGNGEGNKNPAGNVAVDTNCRKVVSYFKR